MKMFAIFEPKTEPSKPALIIHMINDIKQTEWGFERRDKMAALRQFCQDNPGEVAKLIFGSLDEKHKEHILFYYSLDHLGSCSLKDQPFWSQMVRDYIFPRQSELSPNLREQIEWWFRGKTND